MERVAQKVLLAARSFLALKASCLLSLLPCILFFMSSADAAMDSSGENKNSPARASTEFRQEPAQSLKVASKRSDEKAEMKAELKPELNSDLKPEPKSESRSEQKSESRSELKPEPKAPTKFYERTQLRALPGGLNDVMVFNSNSPEMILEDGILLSTFPPFDKSFPECHLNYQFDGHFDVFMHHVTRADTDEDKRVLWLAVLVGNPSNRKVRVGVLSGASYLSQPEAPFITLPDEELNNEGTIYAGPGDRVANEVLRKNVPTFLPDSILLLPGETKVLFSLPLPVRRLRPALNGRSTLLKMKSSAPVHLASLSKFVPAEQAESGPTETEWIESLLHSKLGGPRDKAPTPPYAKTGPLAYGRVAGAALGNQWTATITDSAAPSQNLIAKFEALEGVPNARKAVLEPAPSSTDISRIVESYKKKEEKTRNAKRSEKFLSINSTENSWTFPLCTVPRGTFGTGQIQSAPILVSYGDTAYLANGNYGITYRVEIPLQNKTAEKVDVQVLFRSPVKTDEAKNELTFYQDAPPRAFFRGTVRVAVGGTEKYLHLVQRQGSEGSKLAELTMNPGARRKLIVEFIYPADATPPHVITVKSGPSVSID